MGLGNQNKWHIPNYIHQLQWNAWTLIEGWNYYNYLGLSKGKFFQIQLLLRLGMLKGCCWDRENLLGDIINLK